VERKKTASSLFAWPVPFPPTHEGFADNQPE